MLDHLALGFGEKAQAPPVTQQTGCGTDREGSRIKKRIKQALPAAQLLDPALGPCQVLGFLPRRPFERLSCRRVPRRYRT